MAILNCPACNSSQDVAVGAGGFRCRHCRYDVWMLRCHRCDKTCFVFGSATGAGSLAFRCESCQARNVVQKPRLRAISAYSRRGEHLASRAPGDAAILEREARAQHAEERQSDVETRNQELQERVATLDESLARSLSSDFTFGFASLKTPPTFPAFVDPSPPPHQPAPQLNDFLPPPLGRSTALLTSAKRRHEARTQLAHASYNQALQN